MHVYVWPIYISYYTFLFVVFFAFGEVSHTLFPCCAPSCLLLTEPTCSLKMTTKTHGNNERKTWIFNGIGIWLKRNKSNKMEIPYNYRYYQASMWIALYTLILLTSPKNAHACCAHVTCSLFIFVWHISNLTMPRSGGWDGCNLDHLGQRDELVMANFCYSYSQKNTLECSLEICWLNFHSLKTRHSN